MDTSTSPRSQRAADYRFSGIQNLVSRDVWRGHTGSRLLRVQYTQDSSRQRSYTVTVTMAPNEGWRVHHARIEHGFDVAETDSWLLPAGSDNSHPEWVNQVQLGALAAIARKELHWDQ